MRIGAPEIVSLRAKVAAADEEFQLALAFHESWKPAAYDKTLHDRLGVSFASNTFQVVRLALRREMLLALMRLWDNHKGAVGMGSIANALDDPRILCALAAECEAQWSNLHHSGLEDVPAELVDEVRQSEAEFGRAQAERLRQRAADAVAIIRSYESGGDRHSAFQRFRALRNQRLAHRQVKGSPIKPGEPDDLDAQIQAFYEDMSRLVRLLALAINNTDYDPEATAKINAKNAGLFWAAVKGERTEGHPRYRAPRVHRPGP